ncbi:MAG: glycyl-tRNA synthetase subunit alpha [Epsilonproteobacteria bacterium]|nr:glycyl-tRNA synthetase subunit alpha [Campylobacterota bacterium]
MNTQYWLVGAMWGGQDDALSMFLKRGYWYCWDKNWNIDSVTDKGNSIKNQQERFKKIKINDRIAVKRLLGKGKSEMSILALGIVKDVDIEEWRIYVDWIIEKIENRKVPVRGCLSSIHGPYFLGENKDDDDWIRQIFCL